MLNVAERAETVLRSLSLTPDTRAASGRYRRSKSIRPGVRYWATARLRQQEDVFGVQFHGVGLAEATRLRTAFESAGFHIRNPETSKVTFARAVPFNANDGIDLNRLNDVRHAADAILAAAVSADAGGDFLAFMRASPLCDVELDLPARTIETERRIDF